MASPACSILLVTYNGKGYLPGLAASLEQQGDFELIVVDNASTDGSADLAQRLWPSAQVIRSHKNLGFCAGNNLAARNASGEFLVLLNQDTEVRLGWLAALLGAMRNDASIGVAQSKVLLHRDPSVLNSVGCGMNYLFFGWADRNGERDDVAGAPFEVPYCMGASLAIRRELYARLGGFDEAFWMYHDDLELGLKARLAGFRCVCVPESVVLHKYKETSDPEKLYLFERNRHLMLWKYYHPWTRAVLWPIMTVIDLGILLLAIPQGWWREKLRAHRDAWSMRARARGPDPGQPYRDRELVRLLGARFEVGRQAPSLQQKVARTLMRGYRRVAMLLLA